MPVRMLVTPLLLALALLCPAVAAAQSMTHAWKDVEAIRAAAADAPPAASFAGTYASADTPLWLAPDGRFAIELPRFDDASPQLALTGRWSREGEWLVIERQSTAVDASHLELPDRLRVEAAVLAGDLAMAGGDRERVEELSLRLAESIAALRDHVDDEEFAALSAALEELAAHEPATESPSPMRLLLVSMSDGSYLVDEASLPAVASRWDGGALELRPAFWHRHDTEQAFDGKLVVDKPMAAGLPRAITDLLIPQQLRVRVLELLTPAEELAWSHHRAKARLRIDRGSDAGLFVGQDLFGLPPDEGVMIEVVELAADSAVAEIPVERFAPDDRPPLPAPGMAFSNRPQRTLGCGLPEGVELSAEVLAVDVAPTDLAWDAEGYAWFVATIDRGARDGLAAGDRIAFDSDEGWCACEGRVEAVEPQRASVRFRVQRFDDDIEGLAFPGVGDTVVTPAWQRAQWEARSLEAEASGSDVIVD